MPRYVREMSETKQEKKQIVNREFSAGDYAETVVFYNQIHKHFDINVPGARYVLEVIRRHIPAEKLDNTRILDAGCGYQARVIRLLKEIYTPKEIVGIDVNPANISHCKSLNLDGAHFYVGNLDAELLGSELYDFVCCEGVLMCCEDPMGVLDDLIAATMKNGYILLGIYCWRFPYTFLSWFLRLLGRLIETRKLFGRISGKCYTLVNILDLVFVPV
ncbi:MAG: methyltransferase domain-containing protein, partial [Thermodesulfobacteriota bacterium]|nr:methyltransferase domain-containing protein [Thermodesulfobacteriota bacterium]